MQTMFILRGLPGAGKSTLTTNLDAVVVSADHYFYNKNDEYVFVPDDLPKAHAQCEQRAQVVLNRGLNVAIDNTNCQRWNFEAYIDMAVATGARVCVIDLYDGGLTDQQLFQRNKHGVALETIQAMRKGYEFDWKNADPRKPWMRQDRVL